MSQHGDLADLSYFFFFFIICERMRLTNRVSLVDETASISRLRQGERFSSFISSSDLDQYFLLLFYSWLFTISVGAQEYSPRQALASLLVGALRM